MSTITLANPYAETQRWQMNDADPLDLVVGLYRAALGSIEKARTFVRAGAVRDRTEAIQHAVDCVAELTASLNRDVDAQLSQGLLELYSYVLDRLREANFLQQEAPLLEAAQVLETLSVAWEEARAALQREVAAGAPAAPGSGWVRSA